MQTRHLALLLSLSLLTPAFAQRERPRDEDRREAREAKEAREAREARNERGARGNREDDAVIRAVEKRFPNSKAEVIRNETINGQDVSLVQISTQKGTSKAWLTPNGDFILAAFPDEINVNDLPGPARKIVDSMFAKAPDNIRKYERTTYLVDVDFGRRTYRLEVDPTGRMVDIVNPTERRLEDPSQFEKAGRDEVRSLQDRLQQYFKDPRVKEVYRYPEAPGYFLIDLETGRDKDLQVVMNTQGEVEWWRVHANEESLPRAVLDTIRATSKSARAEDVVRNQTIYYQIGQPLPGGDRMRIQITPTGEILELKTFGHGGEEPDALDDDRRGRQRERD